MSFLNQYACTYRLQTSRNGNIWWSFTQIPIFRHFRHRLLYKQDNLKYLAEGSWIAVLYMTWNVWKCREMDGMVGSGGKWLKMTSIANDWKWLEMAINGWKWLKWFYMAVNGFMMPFNIKKIVGLPEIFEDNILQKKQSSLITHCIKHFACEVKILQNI